MYFLNNKLLKVQFFLQFEIGLRFLNQIDIEFSIQSSYKSDLQVEDLLFNWLGSVAFNIQPTLEITIL
jgi:hypothetical protein